MEQNSFKRQARSVEVRKMFHKHDWEILTQTFSGEKEIEDMKGNSLEALYVLEKLAHGVTITILKCSCGKTKVIETLGKLDK